MFFINVAKKHAIPAKNPTKMLEEGDTKPQAGVMATRPATAPEQNPLRDIFLVR